MDFINEDDLERKIVAPTLDTLEHKILPALLDGLEAKLRRVLDGAEITFTIKLRPLS